MVTGGLCGRVNDGVALLGAAVEGGLIFHAAGTNSCRAWDSVYSFVRHEVPLRTEGDGLHALASFIHDHVPICDRAYRLRLYKNCFVGQHVVDALLEHNMAASRADAVAMCQPLVGPFFQHVVGDHAFKDEWLYYIFHVDRDDPVWSIDLRQRWRPTWRFPPHVRCNSLFLTPAIADAVEEAIGRGDAAAARDALRDVRQRVLSQAFAPQRDRGNPDGWEHVRTTRRGDAPAMWMYRKTAEGKFRTSKARGPAVPPPPFQPRAYPRCGAHRRLSASSPARPMNLRPVSWTLSGAASGRRSSRAAWCSKTPVAACRAATPSEGARRGKPSVGTRTGGPAPAWATWAAPAAWSG